MRAPTALTALVLTSGLLLAVPGTAFAEEPDVLSATVTSPVVPAPTDPLPVPAETPVIPNDPPVIEPAPPLPQPSVSAAPVTPEPSQPPVVVNPAPVRPTVPPSPNAPVTPPTETATPSAMPSASSPAPAVPAVPGGPGAPARMAPGQPAVLDRVVVGERFQGTTPDAPSPVRSSQAAPAAPTDPTDPTDPGTTGPVDTGTEQPDAVAAADVQVAAEGISPRYIAATLLGVVALALAVAIGAVSQTRGARRTH